ncbi:Ribose-phosphate pyrophosphokinase 4 [Hibiscus syriacus]|uniref:Ribose-phosphate pyrophosphokinase 4 n=1 Tax=Hibiscus syriacus TaxID=106335 RepID=A0A6A2X3I4_HIBSY|nr:Ribose-phosphate pyrophosphokinase 4 [Hibiscus syriacus]
MKPSGPGAFALSDDAIACHTSISENCSSSRLNHLRIQNYLPIDLQARNGIDFIPIQSTKPPNIFYTPQQLTPFLSRKNTTLALSSKAEMFYFGDHVLPLFETGIPLLKKRLHQLPDADKIVVAFPDDGAWKLFHKLLDHFLTVICTKVREGDKRIVRLKEGNPADCHVIVDDLVQSGGTLIARHNMIMYIYLENIYLTMDKVLFAHGAAKVSAYVTHVVFPKHSWEPFTRMSDEGTDKGFAYFWITDSCPNTVKSIENRAPFEILSLAGSIADALQI